MDLKGFYMAGNKTMVDIKELKPWKENPKIVKEDDFEALIEQIKDLGQYKPLLVDIDGTILGGNSRYRAFQVLGISQIWVSIVDPRGEMEKVRPEDMNDAEFERLVEARKIKYAFSDNDQKGEYVEEQAAELINKYRDLLNLADYKINTDSGIDLKKLLAKFGPVDPTEPPVTQDEVPPVPDEAKSQYGEIYKLGNHYLVCGDSTDDNVYKMLFQNVKAVMCFTSPPYNAGASATLRGDNKDSFYQNDTDDKDPEEYLSLLNTTLAMALVHCRYVYYDVQLLAGNKRVVPEFWHDNNEYLTDVMIWDKEHTAPAMAENVLNSRFEFVFIFSKYNNSRAIDTANFRGNIDNVYQAQGQHKNDYSGIHGATFPVHLPAYFIHNFTKDGDIILDNFAGTGTTMVAADQLKRRCFMIELDPKYCDVIRQRYAKLYNREEDWIQETPCVGNYLNRVEPNVDDRVDTISNS